MEIISNFIVFEGGDGSGTTTQLKLLSERLKNTANFPYFPTFEPTDGDIGKIIRRALKKESVLEPNTLAFLFAADRNEHLTAKNGILERVERGEFVICDRYALSSLVYQGIECGDELPIFINSLFPAPELTFFLDIDPKIALDRMKNRPSLDIYEHHEFQEKVRHKYLSLIRIYRGNGARVEIIDASQSPQEIADQIWSITAGLPIFKKR